ncbi:hypothetical protein [Rhizobium sp. MHM7A]|uniref:hypothetical protein n=1 Tax=Rhizobium sp. MHM7A TaxID=2583233 RepID=UPI0011058281|nr:hypothetical protein [Rhizobium sp. MHM7A]TLX17132.1 hypothetical protein FFR93_07425 [Rhizobium sp. MHM7A]
MQKISYGFMNPNDGCFLHVFHYEDDPDDGGMGADSEFNLDKFEPIYETEDPAALLDTMIGTQNGRYLSQEALSGGLPMSFRIQIKDYVPVAFVRELRPVVEGGDDLVTSMAVRLVRFDNTADPASLWLDDIENRFDPNPNTGHQLGIR